MKRWCRPWRIIKALSDITYRIEEENRKPGKRRLRKGVHFNYFKPCHSPPEESQPYVEDRAKLEQIASTVQADRDHTCARDRDLPAI